MPGLYNHRVPPQLIINADDFGLTPGINRAIAELHRAGVLSSATLMASGPSFDDAVTLASVHPRLGIGCHVVFVDGTPLADPRTIPSLLSRDGRTFRPTLLGFLQALLTGTISERELTIEAEAQIRRLQQAGITVTHLDTHKHTHIFPQVARTLNAVADQCGIRKMRNPFEPQWASGLTRASLGRRMQLGLLTRLAPSFRTLALDANLMPDGTIGIAATGTLDATTLHALLSHLPAGGTWELCCHPGHSDAQLQAQHTRLRASRSVEYLALLKVVPEILRTRPAVELIHYGDLRR